MPSAQHHPDRVECERCGTHIRVHRRGPQIVTCAVCGHVQEFAGASDPQKPAERPA